MNKFPNLWWFVIVNPRTQRSQLYRCSEMAAAVSSFVDDFEKYVLPTDVLVCVEVDDKIPADQCEVGYFTVVVKTSRHITRIDDEDNDD